MPTGSVDQAVSCSYSSSYLYIKDFIEIAMFLVLLLIFIFACLLLALKLISDARSSYGTLEGNGYPVLKPNFFGLGSTPNLHKEIAHFKDIERFQKYGPIWGLYEGRSSQVFVVDPELIRLIFVKDFDYFHNRRDIDFGNPVMNEILDYLPGEKWKTVRSILSPLFTTSKLRNMSKMIEKVAREFAEQLMEECDENGRLKIDIRKRISAELINMFAETTIGIQLNDYKNSDNAIAVAFRVLMGEGSELGWLYTLSLSFPFLARFAPAFPNDSIELINKTFLRVLEQRRLSGEKRATDFVDILNDIWSQLESEEFKKLGINQDTIISQAVNFFLGGYETSSSTSTILLYYLAKNPQVQEKLFAEINETFVKNGGRIDQEVIREENVPYLQGCINEALRLGPSIIRPERLAMKDWTYNGITIKKGTQVFVPSWAAGRNPEYFPDPETFNPDRFSPANKDLINPYAFTVWGFGPRRCIGDRFAYESLKYHFCHLIRNFRVELRADTELVYKKGMLLVFGIEPLYLDLVKRKQ